MSNAQTTTDRIYQFLLRFHAAQGYFPSQRQIAEDCHVTQPTVFYHLNKLERQGLIVREFGRHGTLRFPDKEK